MSGSNPTSIVLINDPAAPLFTCGGAFAGSPPVLLQQYLATAQTALHTMLIGGKAVVVSYGEGSGQKSVTYQRTQEGALRQHIRELQQLLGLGGRRRAMRIRT